MDNLDWSLFDTPAKRWLAVLTGAAVVTAAVLMQSMFNASTLPERAAEVKRPEVEAAEPAHTRPEPEWKNPEPMAEMSKPVPPVNPSPFEAQDKATVANDPVAMQRRVHQQAEYLRGVIASGHIPKALGNLTKEKVDEMERKGLLIE